ncbi:S9 family peptidase [Geothrix sp. 21YS21S-4]|uniref:alpha/beta hydrolase family protein n=1 Tax=Geothrix sp. 21YS21S-4 TaxID=3068889 RepID=UPI0027B9A208|nr:alpha/beta fold hydrolase [Geothrix sp. 21YS21S-4]
MRTLRLLAPLASLVLTASAPVSTEMALTSSDGFELKGTLTLPDAKGKAPVVILAHEFAKDRAGWAPLATRLADRGIGTLALDLRGHGTSTRKAGADVTVSGNFMASAQAVGFDRIPADLVQAAAWVRKQRGVDGRRIGLAGSSVGAFSSLLAAADVKPVAVLALSPAGTPVFGADARERVKTSVLRAGASVLVLASADDKDAAENALAVKGLPGVAVDMKEGEAHGFAYFADCADLMAVFFGEYLTYHHTGKRYAVPTPTPKPADAIK